VELKDVNILVTGAARGIGHFLASGLLEHVNSVVIADYNKELLDAVPEHPKLRKYTLDVSSAEEVQKTVSQIFTECPGINALVNNAGIIHSEPLINLLSREDKKHSVDNWRRVIDVNLSSVFYVTSNFAEQLVTAKRGGVIINISSITAQGNIGQSAYSASKAGVEALTRTWSKELGMFKIRCACIAPGFFDTPSTRESLNDHMLKKWEKGVPLGRLGQLPELLSAVRFIIENDYYNGKVIQLDGGLTL
jgi:3-oxoacyl-[acyl-carrier protein] reductase